MLPTTKRYHMFQRALAYVGFLKVSHRVGHGQDVFNIYIIPAIGVLKMPSVYFFLKRFRNYIR